MFIYTTNPGIEFISAFRTAVQCQKYLIPFKPVGGIQYLTTHASFGNEESKVYNITLLITVPPCPVAFTLNNGSSSCVCEQLLTRNQFTCNITDQTVQRNLNTMWIGYLSQGFLGIISQCPSDYCNSNLNVSVDNFDNQCSNNRQNVLCGQCEDGLSATFGSAKCINCSNYYFLLVIPFAFMGIALVGLLFALNLTVSMGTIYGLIFYANILKINDEIFFPSNYDNFGSKFFLTFIAWLNLDLGIGTCFYNGMDSYAKTWLQFVFPVYLYTLVGIIVFAGRYSSKVSNLCRFNAVPVLSTIILLSYSKLLRTIITIFSFVSVDSENATSVPLVWRYDGNIQFFRPKHIALFVFGLCITVLIIIPYTFTLLFLPCLQLKSGWRILWWVNKLKPFFDSHAAPFKDRYRFWAGVLLVFRLPLYLLFSIQFSITVRLLGIVIFTYLYSLSLIGLSVYKRWQHLLLEIFFQLNLMVLSVAHLFDANYTTSPGLYAILLFGLLCSFLCFFAIVIVHIHKMVRMKISPKNSTPLQEPELKSYPLTALVDNTNSIDLRETLLDD